MINFLITLGLVLWFIINLIITICYVVVSSEDCIEQSIPYWIFVAFGFIFIFSSWYWWIISVNIFNF